MASTTATTTSTSGGYNYGAFEYRLPQTEMTTTAAAVEGDAISDSGHAGFMLEKDLYRAIEELRAVPRLRWPAGQLEFEDFQPASPGSSTAAVSRHHLVQQEQQQQQITIGRHDDVSLVNGGSHTSTVHYHVTEPTASSVSESVAVETTISSMSFGGRRDEDLVTSSASISSRTSSTYSSSLMTTLSGPVLTDAVGSKEPEKGNKVDLRTDSAAVTATAAAPEVSTTVVVTSTTVHRNFAGETAASEKFGTTATDNVEDGEGFPGCLLGSPCPPQSEDDDVYELEMDELDRVDSVSIASDDVELIEMRVSELQWSDSSSSLAISGSTSSSSSLMRDSSAAAAATSGARRVKDNEEVVVGDDADSRQIQFLSPRRVVVTKPDNRRLELSSRRVVAAASGRKDDIENENVGHSKSDASVTSSTLQSSSIQHPVNGWSTDSGNDGNYWKGSNHAGRVAGSAPNSCRFYSQEFQLPLLKIDHVADGNSSLTRPPLPPRAAAGRLQQNSTMLTSAATASAQFDTDVTDTSAEDLFEEIMESMHGDDDDYDDDVAAKPKGAFADAPPTSGRNSSASGATSDRVTATKNTTVRTELESASVSLFSGSRFNRNSTGNECNFGNVWSVSEADVRSDRGSSSMVFDVGAAPQRLDGQPTSRHWSAVDEDRKQRMLNDCLAIALEDCLNALSVAEVTRTSPDVVRDGSTGSVFQMDGVELATLDQPPATTKDQTANTATQLIVCREMLDDSQRTMMQQGRGGSNVGKGRVVKLEAESSNKELPVNISVLAAEREDDAQQLSPPPVLPVSRRTTATGSCIVSTSSGVHSGDDFDVDIEVEFGINSRQFQTDGGGGIGTGVSTSLDSLLDYNAVEEEDDKEVAEEKFMVGGGNSQQRRVDKANERPEYAGIQQSPLSSDRAHLEKAAFDKVTTKETKMTGNETVTDELRNAGKMDGSATIVTMDSKATSTSVTSGGVVVKDGRKGHKDRQETAKDEQLDDRATTDVAREYESSRTVVTSHSASTKTTTVTSANGGTVMTFTKDQGQRLEILSDELLTQEIVLKVAWPRSKMSTKDINSKKRRKMTTTHPLQQSAAAAAVSGEVVLRSSGGDKSRRTTSVPFRNLHVHRVVRIMDADDADGDIGARKLVQQPEIEMATASVSGSTADRHRPEIRGDVIQKTTTTTDTDIDRGNFRGHSEAAAGEGDSLIPASAGSVLSTNRGNRAVRVELDRRADTSTVENQPDGSRYHVTRANRMRVVHLPGYSPSAVGISTSGIDDVVEAFGRKLDDERRLRRLPDDVRVTCEATERRSGSALPVDDVTVVRRTIIESAVPRILETAENVSV